MHQEIPTEESLKLLQQSLPEKHIIILKFTADWCGPCKRIASDYERLSLQYTDIVFLKVNVDNSPDISGKYKVRSMPTFVFLNNNNVYATTVGASLPMIENNLETLNEIVNKI